MWLRYTRSPLPSRSSPGFDLRLAARRAAVPVTLAATALGVLLLAGGRLEVLADALSRALSADPRWIAVAAVGGAALVRRLHRPLLARGRARDRAARPAHRRGDHARRRRRHPDAPHRGGRRRRADALGDGQDRPGREARGPRAAHLHGPALRRVPRRDRPVGRGDRARVRRDRRPRRGDRRRRDPRRRRHRGRDRPRAARRRGRRRRRPPRQGGVRSAPRYARRGPSCGAATSACSARPPGGCSTPPCCGRRSRRSASRRRSP